MNWQGIDLLKQRLLHQEGCFQYRAFASDVFEARTEIGSEHFACQDSGLSQIFKLRASIDDYIITKLFSHSDWFLPMIYQRTDAQMMTALNSIFFILNLNQSQFFAKHTNQLVCFILSRHQITSVLFSCLSKWRNLK